MSNPIKPTIGRNVWYFPTAGAKEQHANIVDVHSDTMVNLFTVNHGGTASGVTSVPFAGDDDKPTGPHWRWMPYQIGQAKAPATGVMGAIGAVAETQDLNARKIEDNGVLTDYGRSLQGDGGVLEGTNRDTSGAIGQP
jgi:hypothetical protein